MDLIARCAIALQKRDADLIQLHSIVFAARIRAAIRFKQIHARTIHDYNFKRCNLILQWNSQIEYALDWKLKPRYLGPLIVISRNKGGAYILCKLDGTVLQRPVAAFRLVPYFARTSIYLPDNFIDIDATWLAQLKQMDLAEDRKFINIQGLTTKLFEDDEDDIE